ncbi:MAG: pyrophosphatase [Nanoarchaeota archaeon]|nr:pyrophosphatase [Nanoarchaeota archaeon]MBU1104255.1 pyrophosphatase [Nanoarchaeota archaeon]
MYKLDNHTKPKLLGVERLENFKNILQEEVNEVDEIIKKYKEKSSGSEQDQIEILTDLSDWLGDMVVYIASECARHGIDLNKTLEVIMQSNFSKLGEDGKPIYDERNKVMKGPNYWKPEPKISELLKETLNQN